MHVHVYSHRVSLEHACVFVFTFFSSFFPQLVNCITDANMHICSIFSVYVCMCAGVVCSSIAREVSAQLFVRLGVPMQ